MTNLRHVEIEFRNASGEIETRVFPRAFEATFTDYVVSIRDAESQLYLTDRTRVVRFDSRPVSALVSEQDRVEMDWRVRSLCGDGQRISAIKEVRRVLGLGLRDAKAYVDEHCPREPINYDDIPF